MSRHLKLTGMLDTLDARLAEARAGTLGHVEFLQVLCQDEVARREAAAVARRLRAARLPSTATLESFDFGFNPKLPAAQIRDLARLEFIAAGESLFIHGPVGVGKTHVAVAVATTSCSPPAAGCWPSSPADTPTTASRSVCADSPNPRCWSSTTSGCGTSAPPRPTTSTSCCATGWAARAARWC